VIRRLALPAVGLVAGVAFSSGAVALFGACSSTATSVNDAKEAGVSDASVSSDAPATNDGGRDVAAVVDADSGVAPSLCAATRAFVVACGGSLTCGDAGFDPWCADNDRLMNSESFRRAERRCLAAPQNCAANARRDCDYRAYAGEQRTAAQQKLVDDYCATCFPQDVAACKTRSVTYDPDAGPAAVDDIFVAAWELSDSLTNDIDTQCTGAALDAGGSDGGCVRAFADCAGGLYVDRLPNCP
jgi:hypothetical protein